MNICKYAEKLKYFYSEHPQTQHRGSIIDILVYWCYHVFIHFTILYPSINLSYFSEFQSNLQK